MIVINNYDAIKDDNDDWIVFIFNNNIEIDFEVPEYILQQILANIIDGNNEEIEDEDFYISPNLIQVTDQLTLS
jgi:hypothetical protein